MTEIITLAPLHPVKTSNELLVRLRGICLLTPAEKVTAVLHLTSHYGHLIDPVVMDYLKGHYPWWSHFISAISDALRIMGESLRAAVDSLLNTFTIVIDSISPLTHALSELEVLECLDGFIINQNRLSRTRARASLRRKVSPPKHHWQVISNHKRRKQWRQRGR